jgi:hypothetical protein
LFYGIAVPRVDLTETIHAHQYETVKGTKRCGPLAIADEERFARSARYPQIEYTD